MNESKNIVPEIDCIGCGKCCESFEIGYPNPPKKEMKVIDAVWRSEIDRFKMLVGIGDKITTLDDGDCTWLIFTVPCKYLLSNKTCEIYDNPIRPLLCRKFPYPTTTKNSCPKIRQTKEGE
jgi:Fe-S-cluster containining protein